MAIKRERGARVNLLYKSILSERYRFKRLPYRFCTTQLPVLGLHRNIYRCHDHRSLVLGTGAGRQALHMKQNETRDILFELQWMKAGSLLPHPPPQLLDR